ncbi:hypothetical protein [Anaeromyxobacter sp. PSR-1]|uniref:hypothetical protein n=1 Tax=Anaeromyxobacter sp. PSR-1 TaxID=1300915 RepID=UPI0005DE6557|nr:hypothetical protein [Anaeromyxobacter sp. PSR-1]GAO01952.1 hypothetical protein PSR1_00817 [Anaeromyxobacter sp. PSR-1]
MRLWRRLYLDVRLWAERRSWSLISAVALLGTMLAFVFLVDEHPWLTGMRGNLIGEVAGGVIFLLVGFHFGRKVEDTILRRAEMDHHLERMNRFITFLESEGHYDVIFPSLATKREPYGLIYRVEPVRLGGKALKRTTEIETSYLLMVARPAYEEILSPEQLADYERSPITIGRRYFCRFFNGAWHMGLSTYPGDWHEFHMFGKQGEFEDSVTAEEFYAEAARSTDRT